MKQKTTLRGSEVIKLVAFLENCTIFEAECLEELSPNGSAQEMVDLLRKAADMKKWTYTVE